MGDIRIMEGRLCIAKSKTNPILSIDSWTSAFIIFISVMIEKFPAKAQELLKYLRDIRIAATRSNLWPKYDEQFRLRMSNHPLASWGQINQEFWLLYVSNQAQPQKRTQSNQRSNFTSSNQASHNTNMYCRFYNKGMNCNFFPRCKYRHACSKCGDNHPSTRC